MKQVLILLLLLALIQPNTYAQDDITVDEIEDLASKVASKIDKKNRSLKKWKRNKKIMVEDFRDAEGNLSRLGANLAEEFTLAISTYGETFSVIEKAVNARGLDNSNDASQRAQDIGSTILETREAIDKKPEEDFLIKEHKKKQFGDAIVSGSRLLGKKNKGADAIITGTLTPYKSDYRLVIKVVSLKKENTLLAHAKGNITKTPSILALGAEDIRERSQPTSSTNRPDILTSKGNSYGFTGGIGGKAVSIFKKDQITFELLECRQIGQSIECKVRITNEGPDINLGVFKRDSRIIAADGGYEYGVGSIKLADKVGKNDGNGTWKTLVSNTPIEAIITYTNITKDIRRISKAEITCTNTRWHYRFVASFRDIPVIH